MRNESQRWRDTSLLEHRPQKESLHHSAQPQSRSLLKQCIAQSWQWLALIVESLQLVLISCMLPVTQLTTAPPSAPFAGLMSMSNCTFCSQHWDQLEAVKRQRGCTCKRIPGAGRSKSWSWTCRPERGGFCTCTNTSIHRKCVLEVER